MLKKLTSPKAKAAARAPADKELGGLAAIPDDKELKAKRDTRSSKATGEKSSIGIASQAAAASKDPKPTKKMRDELSLDMSALVESVASDEGTPQADEGLAKEKSGYGERRKTLARSPRVKNILDDDRMAAREDANPTPRGKTDAKLKASAHAIGAKEPPPSSPVDDDKSKKPIKKGGLSGLKALRSSSKSKKKKEEKHESSDEKEIPASDSARGKDAKHAAASPKETKLKSGKKAEDKSESKRIDEQVDEAANHETDHEEQSRGDSTQKPKSSLSPLRRRKPNPDIAEIGGRSSKEHHLLGHRMKMRDLPPANQPEVHIIGEITSGESFGSGGFACKWGVEYGSLWHHIAGDQLGQTQIDYSSSSSHPIVWSHPIDLHFATTSFNGWPKLLLQVWQTDTHMKTNVVGYGFTNLPFSPGEHRLTVSMWRPMGSAKEEMAAKLLGRTQELVSEDAVFNSAWVDRSRLQTTATGKVHVQVGIILRNFHMPALEM